MIIRTRGQAALTTSMMALLVTSSAFAQQPAADTDEDAPEDVEVVELGIEEQSAALLAAFQGERHRLIRAAATPDPMQTNSDGSVLLNARIDASWDEVALDDLANRLSAPALHTGEVPVTVRLPGGQNLELSLHAELLVTFERLVERALAPTARLVALDANNQRLGMSDVLVAVIPHRLGLHGLDLGRPPRVELWRPTVLRHPTDAGWERLDTVTVPLTLGLDDARTLERLDVLRGNDPDFIERSGTAQRARVGAALATAGFLPDPTLGFEQALAEGALSVNRCDDAELLARPLAQADPSPEHLTRLARSLACQSRWAEAAHLLAQAGKALAPADAQRHLGVLELQLEGPVDGVVLHSAGWAPQAERGEGIVRWSGLTPGLYRVSVRRQPGFVADGDQLLEVVAGNATRSRLEMRALPEVEGTFTTPAFDPALQVMVGTPPEPLAPGVTLDARPGPLALEVSLPDWQVSGAPIWVRDLPQLAAPEDLLLPAAIAVESDDFDISATVGPQRFLVPAGQSRAVLAQSEGVSTVPVLLEVEGFGAFSGALDIEAGALSRLQVRPDALPAYQARQQARRSRDVALVSAVTTGALLALSTGFALLATDRWGAARDAAASAEGAGPTQGTLYQESLAEAERNTTWANVWIAGAVVAGAGAVASGVTFTLPQTMRWLKNREIAESARTETLPLEAALVESP